jgi:shikimate 5-dehydrogenase
VDIHQRLPKSLTTSASLHEFSWQDLNAIAGALTQSDLRTLVIHATNAAIDPLPAYYPIFAKLSVPKTLFYDLNYSVGRQFLMDWAAKEKRRTCNGLAMLIEQARLSQEIWFGRSLGFQDILAALER